MSLNILRECERVFELGLDMTPRPKYEAKSIKRSRFKVPLHKYLMRKNIPSQDRFMTYHKIDKAELERLYEFEPEKLEELVQKYKPIENERRRKIRK